MPNKIAQLTTDLIEKQVRRKKLHKQTKKVAGTKTKRKSCVNEQKKLNKQKKLRKRKYGKKWKLYQRATVIFHYLLKFSFF